MKRIVTLGLVLGLIATFGCAPRTTTPTPTVTPLTSPHVSPAVTPKTTPQVTNGTVTPNGAVTPGVTANNENISIPDFREGTAVMMTDLPLIKSAFETKYKDYEIVGVTHAARDNEQLYRIEYKDASGKTQEAFIRPSGTWYEGTAVAPASNVE